MSDAPTTPDPIEIAMEAEATGAAPQGLAQDVLRGQSALFRWQIANERAAFALRLVGVAAALVAAGLVGLMLWRASQARGLVIEAFDVPPALAERGLTGKVLATQVQDRLDRMQAETVTPLVARRVSNRWSGDIKVEIAASGVSLGEVDRLLRQWLGDEVRVSGEAYAVTARGGAPGVALTVRTSAGPGDKLLGTEAGLDALLQSAAETVLRQMQPNRYADWLVQRGRDTEALTISRWVAEHAAPPERAVALLRLNDLARLRGERNAGRFVDAARELDPESPMVWSALTGRASGAGHLEEALANSLRAEQLARRSRNLSADGIGLLVYTQRSNRESWLGDYLGSLADAERQRRFNGAAQSAAGDRVLDAFIMAAGHDVSGANAVLAETPLPANASARARRDYESALLRTRAEQLAALEDWPRLLAATAAVEAQDPRALKNDGFLMYKARALAGVGRFAEARAVIGATSPDFYGCVIVRARVAAAAGDAAGAERWFAAADKLGPSLPQAPEAWGRFLLARGQSDAAISKAKIANRRSPRYGDPLELWGEALLAKGDAKGAAEKFAQAAKFTPRWARLHLKWGEALAREGKAAEAQARWRLAAGMDLTAAERAELAKVMR